MTESIRIKHPRIKQLEDLLKVFSPPAQAFIRSRRRPRSVGGTLRPGRETPLWNQLVTEIRPLLKQRGEKAQLARLLGLQRQAVNEYFVRGSRMPDAERTLLLVEWVQIRLAGRKPGW